VKSLWLLVLGLMLPAVLIPAATANAQVVDASGKTIHVFQVDEAPEP